MMRVFFIAEIVGSGGVYAVKSGLKRFAQDKNIDFVVANADGATGGFGLGRAHSAYIHKLGVDVITGGDCIYYKKDMVAFFPKAGYTLRPANYPFGNPGRGYRICEKNGKRLAVISLLGQAGYTRTHLSSPLGTLQELSQKIKKDCPHILVDFHATTTAEKATMFFFGDGKVSAVCGTGFKVQTADEQILKGGTAVITDAGRTGSRHSIGGLEPEIELRKFKTGIPERSSDAWEDLSLQGILVDFDETGKAVSIQRVMEPVEAPRDRNIESLEA
jgi:metallophosphoesterase (TIGR00282 family)